MFTCIVTLVIKITEVPNKPSLTFNEDYSQVCFGFNPYEDNKTSHFGLFVADVTTENVYRDMNITNNCTYIDDLLAEGVCAPYKVSVRAYEEHGVFSETTITLWDNDTGMKCVHIILLCHLLLILLQNLIPMFVTVYGIAEVNYNDTYT